MAAPYIIISCGKKKKAAVVEIPLEELYNSRLAKGKMALAKLITNRKYADSLNSWDRHKIADSKDPSKKLEKLDISHIYVLSGNLGLVPLASKAVYYDSHNHMPDKRKVWGQVRQYAMKARDTILYIGQKTYYAFLKRNFYPHLVNLLTGTIGSGEFTVQVYEIIKNLPIFLLLQVDPLLEIIRRDRSLTRYL